MFEQVTLVIINEEDEDVNFVVRNRSGIITSNLVTAGKQTNITIDRNHFVYNAMDRDKGLIISTESFSKISVYVVISHVDGFSAGIYQSFPAWGYPVNSYMYYAVTLNNTNTLKYLLIVSNNDNTVITVTPTVDIVIPQDLSPTGTDIVVKVGTFMTLRLQYLQTLLIDSYEDLSGTKVEANKPIVILSGHTCVRGTSYQLWSCNTVYSQVPPVASWGISFLATSFTAESAGYVLKLINSYNDTSINVTCQSNLTHNVKSLAEGSIESQLIPGANICYIRSNKPILVTQFAIQKQLYPNITNLETNIDVAMLILPSIHQYSTNVAIHSITTRYSANLMNVVAVSRTAFNPDDIQINNRYNDREFWTEVNLTEVNAHILSELILSSGQRYIVSSNDNNTKLCPVVFGLSVFLTYGYNGNLSMHPFGHQLR